jgi:hypothetical protein
MFSNEKSSYGNRIYGYTPKPPVPEDVLRTEKIQVERKTFILTLRENPRGRFLRITEDVGGRHNSVIVPATGLEDFKKLVDEMVKLSDETPPKNPETLPQ